MDRKILDSLDEIIYVSDIETNELLYLNNAGITQLGVDNYIGMKCYKILQGKEQPCEFCNNYKLSEDEWFTWSIVNKLNNQYYTLKDKIIYINNRKCRLEIAINNNNLINENQKVYEKIKLEKIIRNIMFAISEGNKEQEFLIEICEFVSADRGYIFYYDLNKNKIFNSWTWNKEGVSPLDKSAINIEEDPAKVWRGFFNKEGYVLLENIDCLKEDFPIEYEVLKKQNINSIVVVPIHINNKLYGFIGLDNPKSNEISLEILQSISVLLSINYQKNKYYEDMKLLSECDKLTGVKNRNSFMNFKADLNKKQNNISSLGVIFIDINKLKEGNDRFGHEYGDKMITSVANEIIEIWGAEKCFRIGGDEFIIIVEDISEKDFIKKIDIMNDNINNNTIATISLGYIWCKDNINIEKMIAKSDQQMYENKKDYYKNNMISSRFRYESANEEKTRLKNELLKALEEKEFFVVYQPKVNNKTGELIGLEALIRNKKGIPPNQFISFYENNGLIYIIDYFMLNEVSKQIEELKKDSNQLITISINICEKTLLRDDFIEIFTEYIIDKGLTGGIEIELTEKNISINDLSRIKEVITIIREKGAFVSLDDFGTGSANMLLTTLLDITALKIDISLIEYIHKNEKVQIILKSIIDACKTMGIQIVAEGVENQEQLEVLKQLGNTMCQGYYFSKPKDINEIKKQYNL